MAILWSREIDGVRYEVRGAGRTRRLYTNGILHTQYNPARPLTGNLWDLFLLGAYFDDPARVRRVLVLGVGGGAVIRQLQRFIGPEHITAVELSGVHLRIARRFFGVRPSRRLELVQADAREWLAGHAGPAFDLVVEDLFVDRDGEAERALPADRAWFRRLCAVLAPGGALVMNFGSHAELRDSAGLADPAVRRRFASVFRLATPQNENAVGVFLLRASSSRALRRRLEMVPELDPRKAGGMRYSIRSLK